MQNLGRNADLQNVSISRLESIQNSVMMILVHFALVQALKMSDTGAYRRGV